MGRKRAEEVVMTQSTWCRGESTRGVKNKEMSKDSLDFSTKSEAASTLEEIFKRCDTKGLKNTHLRFCQGPGKKAKGQQG